MGAEASIEEDISRKLDVVIGLLAELCARSNGVAQTRERIRLLHDLGAARADIARAVGKGSKYVAATLTQVKRSTMKGKGKRR